jgi:hypothetical protein
MAVLTRIKNNQITDSTILANTKIVPGSIVGSLFNANLTVASDVTITGNLTVQGASSYLTVASTNTYVNDPLIVLNNAFTGTNSYDVGLIFNRGNQISTALIWNEGDNQFELTYTTETGTSYATIDNSGFANLKVGNLTVAGITTIDDIGAGNLTLTGDLAVNGGDLTTTATTFNLLNTDATTISAFGAATTLGIGASTGTLTLNNATVTTPGQIVSTRAGSATTGDGQIYLNGSTGNRIDWNTNGTGAPAFTTRTDGTKVVLYPALSGSTVDYAIGIDSATLWTSVPEYGDSFNFKWYGATTLVANLSGTGNFTTVGDVAVNGGDLTTTAATFNLIDTDATTVNFAGAATTIDIGATTGTLTINNPTVVGSQTTQDLYNTVATTLNFAGAATTLIVGATTGIANIRNATTNIIGNATVGGKLTMGNIITLANGAVIKDTSGNAVAFGHSAGLTSQGPSSVAIGAFAGENTQSDYAVAIGRSAGLTTQATETVAVGIYSGTLQQEQYAVAVGAWAGQYNQSIGSIAIGYEAAHSENGDYAISIGYKAGYLAQPARTIVLNASGDQTNGVAAQTDSFYVNPIRNATGNVGTLQYNSVTKEVTYSLDLTLANITLTGDLAVNGGDLTTTASAFNLLNSNATTVDAFKAATDLEFGATTGTLTINNPTVVGSQTTQDLYNTTATTVNAFGAATTLIVGATTGIANIRNATTNVLGNLVVAGTMGVTGAVTLTDDLAVNGGDLTTSASTFNLVDANATTVNFAGAATTIDLGATTGTLTINNPTVVGSQTTQDVFNTTATTVNAFGAATTLILGDTSGTANIRNATTNIEGNAVVGATLSANSIQATPIGSVTAASGKFTSVTDESLTATRVTFAGTGGDLDDSANLTFVTDTLSIRNVSINGETNTIAAVGGNLNLSASTNVIDGNGATVANIADPTDLQDAVTLSYLNTQINSGVTNLQTDNSDITITDNGNVAGVITTNVDGVLVSTITTNSAAYFTDLLVIDDATSNVSVGGSLFVQTTSQFIGNVTVDASVGRGFHVSNSTAQFAKTVTFDANVDISGNINATDTTQSINSSTGAITTLGGVGIAQNLNVGGDVVITGNLQVDGSVTSVNTATLDVEDLNITVAKGAANPAAANGAGLTIDGANATILWTNATQSVNFNKNIVTPGANFTGTVTVAPRFTVTSFDGNSVTTLSGNDITTSATTANLFNTTATTINFAGGATALILGSTTGIANIRNATTNIIGAATVGSTLSVTGETTLTANLAVNGGDITTTASTFNLVNANATTVDAFKAATDLEFGATSGTLTINNPAVVGTQATQDVFNTNATTVNAFGAATTLIVGATTGIANIRNETTNIIGNATVGGTLGVTGHVTLEGVTSSGATGTGNIVFSNSPVLTTPNIGTPGFANLSNATDLPISTGVSGLATGVATFLATPSSSNLITVVTDETGTGNLVFSTSPVLTTPNIGTPSFANLSNATGLPLTGVTGFGANVATFLATPSSSNLLDAVTDETGTGNLVFSTSPTLETSLVAGTSSFDLVNTTATTVNFAGAATTLSVGAATGTTTVNNDLDVALTVTARDINSTVIGNVSAAAGTFTTVTDTGLTATRITYAGTGGLLSDSSDFTFASNILTVKNFSINGDTAEISVIGGSGNVTLNPDAGGVIDATGSLISNIANPVSAQDAVTLDYLTTTLASASATSILQNNTDVTVSDSGNGTITANVDAVNVFTISNSSANFYNGFVTFTDTTSNVTIDGLAYISGNATVSGELSVAGQVTFSDTTESDFSGGGALSVDGGISAAKSITAGGNLTVDGANVTFGDNTVFYSSYTTINNQGIYHEQGSGRRSIQIKANDNTYGGGIASGDSNGTYVYSATGMQFATGTTLRTSLYPTTLGNIGVQITQNGNLIAQSGTVSTSISTGALVVVGGVGISDSLFVGNGAVINDTQSNENFVVKGTNSSSLFLADSTNNAVVFGGNLTSAVAGSIATFTGSSAIILPVGDVSQRPSNSGATDVIGMARYSTSSNNIEFFDGTSWQVAGSSFTLVTTNAFTGNGVATNFTLSAPSTTSALIVAINGVVQYPTLSYSVGGINSDVLTFTEAPAVGDIIDARALSTSTTVSALSNGNGYVQFKVNDTFANVIAGTSTVETRMSISAATGTATFMNDVVINGNLTVKGDTAGNINLGDSNTDNVIFFADINSNVIPNGNEVHNLGATDKRWANTYTDALVARIIVADPAAVSVGTSDVVIDTFDATVYRSAKYVLSISNSSLGEYETAEVLVVHNGTTAYKNQYATMYTGTASLGTISATYTSGTVELSYQGANAGNAVKIQTTYIKV